MNTYLSEYSPTRIIHRSTLWRPMSACLLLLCLSITVGCNQPQKPEKHKANSEKADSLMYVIYEEEDSNRFDDAMIHVREALAIYEQLGDSIGLSDCYSEMVVCNQRIGNLTAAIEAGQEAIKIDEALGENERLSSDYNNMAGVYLTSKQIPEAKSFIDKAIYLDENEGRIQKLSIRYGLATEIYVKIDSLDKALDFAKKALNLDTKAKDTLKMGRRMSQMADVYLARKEYGKAVQLYQDAIVMLTKMKERTSTCITYKQLGQTYMRMGQTAKARECLEKSLQMAKNLKSRYLMQSTSEHLGNLLSQSDPLTAMEYMKLSSELKDSLYNEKNAQLLSSFAARFESAEKAHTIEQQEAKLRTHKIYIWVAVAFVILLSMLCGALYYMFRERTRSRNATQKLINVRNTFFTNITHEFRTPLTLVHGLSHQMLVHPEMSQEERQRCLTDIQDQGDSLLELVGELLEASKMMSETQTPTWMHGNVAAYIAMTVEAYRSFAATQSVTLHYQPEVSDVEADFIGNYLAKILRNLISNSLKYMPGGGDIIVSLQTNKNHLQLHVEDTGGGIAEEDIENIFEPFYRGQSSKEGNSSGIGLNYVQQMVQQMGGTVKASNTQQGAKFSVMLPRYNEKADKRQWDGANVEAPKPLAQPATAHYATPTTITATSADPSLLIVEDNPEIAHFIGMVMGSNYNIQFAMNGEEALQKAQENMPDILLTDLMMPLMDGLELCRRVRSSDVLNHIPIIVISAKDSDNDRLEALQAGADAYLIKPFNADELTLRVEQLLRQRQLLRQKFASGLPADNDYSGLKEGERQFLERLTSLIEAQLSNRDLNTDMLADGMKMTRSQLNGKTRAVTGNTANNYIARIRMDRAARMLKNSDRNIGEVAMKCGFDDVSYFSRVFKQTYECTPSQYRKEAQNDK
ncbi:MAG: response regulator [Prevotella sp.]|nr:response regulator [Prevotella sp.]